MNKYICWAVVGLVGLTACNKDEFTAGNPTLNIKSETSEAYFGDSLQFTVSVSDQEVPLSTLKAELFLGEEKVSQTVIRTKESGHDYTGKIYVPYLATIADGAATLKYTLQNINFTTAEKEVSVNLKRADYPYLTLVTEEGAELRMERTALYQYSVLADFPQELKGYIKTPEMAGGNTLTFGWRSGAIDEGTTSLIPFSNITAGYYAIEFNTLTYAASPFVQVMVNGVKFEELDSESIFANLTLSQGQAVVFEGIAGLEDWWIDTDFFTQESNGALTFAPISGSYRIVANSKLKCFFVLALSNGAPATLQSDGTGAIWIIGNTVGKPSVAAKEVGWTTENGLCMPQAVTKKYQVTLVAGSSVNSDNIDFKFFHQQGWGGEFTGAELTSTSDVVGVRESGNLYLLEGKTLTEGHTYKFVVDVTAGITSAVLTVTDEGIK